MRRQTILVCLLVGCCAGLVRLSLMYIYRSWTPAVLLGLGSAALCLLALAWGRRGGARQPHGLPTALAVSLAGWLVVPSLVFALLLAPSPQRWALIGGWETVAEANGPMLVRQEFSPWGTLRLYRDGQLGGAGRYVFVDDRTIEIEWRSVPARIGEGPQYDRYRLEFAGDTLTMTWTRVDDVTVYRRAGG